MFYLVKTPWLLKKLYPTCIWDFPTTGKKIYLTFDDGPHPQETPFVLEQLAKYDAKATFFCVGENVVAYPDIYKKILQEGHSTGNHTFTHVNGWKIKDEIFFSEIKEAGKFIDSSLFRPPYGKVTRFQLKYIQSSGLNLKVIMWGVVSGDFDEAVTPEKCLRNVLKNARSGDIIVFHDSEKASEKIRYALPRVLMHFSEQDFAFEKISNQAFCGS
jgi:peptidoglycan/xylan/chitin deacetylase (PgdA/CDA1 family)